MLSGGYRRHHTKLYHQMMQFMLVLCIVGKRASCDTVPPHAMATGHTSKGETLYIGSGNWQGNMTSGKVDPSHGKEISLKQNEVLAAPDTWVAVENNNVPFLHAVYAGLDSNKDAMFVGRANHEGDLLPAKVLASNGRAYIGYNAREYIKNSFEVLVGDGYSWSGGYSDGIVPANAVKGGSTSYGETLYIGRANLDGSFTPGKIHPSQKRIYIPYRDMEVYVTDYQVLVRS